MGKAGTQENRPGKGWNVPLCFTSEHPRLGPGKLHLPQSPENRRDSRENPKPSIIYNYFLKCQYFLEENKNKSTTLRAQVAVSDTFTPGFVGKGG